MRIFILETERERAAAVHHVTSAPLGAVVTVGDQPSTVAQRGAFWAIMAEIAEALWIEHAPGQREQHDAETWAEYFLARYAPRREVYVGGVPRWLRLPLARIDAPAFGIMLGRIEAEAAGLGMEFHETRDTLDQWRATGERIARHVVSHLDVPLPTPREATVPVHTRGA